MLVGALVSSPAWARPVAEIDVGATLGYRHSFVLGAGGIALGASIGGFIGRFGLEYETLWSNDHTLKVSERIAGRNDNRFNVMVSVIGRSRFRLVLGGGGSLGWVKYPGAPSGPGAREPSQGVQEFLRIDLRMVDSDVSLFYGIRVGASHRWQPAIVPAPDHAVEVALVIAFGPSID
mgnify:CR=1 FL=1